MAKVANAAQSNPVEGNEFAFRTLGHIYKTCQKLETEVAIRFLVSSLVKVPGLPHWNTRDGYPDGFQILVGPSGCGKTQMLKQVLRNNGFDISVLKFDGTIEDVCPIPTQEEDPTQPGKMKKLAYDDFYFEPRGPRKAGVMFIDEMLSGDVELQKAARGLISDQQLCGVKKNPSWFPMAATNPTDSEYLDTHPPTRSLEDRAFYLPVKSDFNTSMNYWAGHNRVAGIRIPDEGKEVAVTPVGLDGAGGFHEKLYTFLLLNKGDGPANFLPACSPRRWNLISWFMIRQDSSGLISQDEQIKWLSLVCHEEVVKAYVQFLQQGSDPLNYPIMGHKWLSAGEKDHAEHMQRLSIWQKNPEKSFIGKLTALEVHATLMNYRDMEVDGKPRLLSERELLNCKDLILNIEDEMAAQVLGNVTGQLGDQIWPSFRKTEKMNRLVELTGRLIEAQKHRA